MLQEIVLSVDCLNYLSKKYREYDFNSEGHLFMQRVQEDILCFDEKRLLDEKIETRILELNDEVLLRLWTGIIDFINQKRYSISSSIKSTEALEGNVCNNSKDGIWVKPGLTIDRKSILKKKYGNNRVNPISEKNYLHPTKKDFLLVDGLNFLLKKNDNFPIAKYIKACAADTENILIQDGYLVRDLPKNNLIKILKNVPSDATVKIRTLTDNARNNFMPVADDGHSVFELEDEIKSKCPQGQIDFETFDRKSQLHDRFIITDKWKISLGRGLDSYKNAKILAEHHFFLNAI